MGIFKNNNIKEIIIMGISGITTGGLSNNLTFQNQIGMTVLKKAQEIDAQSALQLIQSIPNVQNLPSHLGQNINTTA